MFKDNVQSSRWMDDYIAKRIAEGWSSCFSIALSDAEHILYETYQGETDANTSSKVRGVCRNTRYNIGSVTKIFTASFIAKLVESGELTLRDPVKRFIPEYPFDGVNIFHLLTHSAGYSEDASPQVPSNLVGKSQFLKSIYEIDQLKYAVGERPHYFTAGYTILMDVIERVVSDSIESFGREVMFHPLGMKETTFDMSCIQEEDVVFPIRVDGRIGLELAETVISGDTGLYTHPADLMKFGRMILGRGSLNGTTVFHERTIDWMLRRISSGLLHQTPVFWVKTEKDIAGCFADIHSPAAVGHTGFSGCMLWIDPVYERTGAILTNSEFLHTDWTHYQRMNNALLSLAISSSESIVSP